jgi:hypothetical protein
MKGRLSNLGLSDEGTVAGCNLHAKGCNHSCEQSFMGQVMKEGTGRLSCSCKRM